MIRESKKPVFASHSNAYTLCPHPRNLTNDQLKAIAAAGGVIGINFYPDFLTESAQATIVDVVHHIEYVADLVGLDHVAIGSDFDGIDRTPEGLDDVTHLPRLIDALLDRGFSANDVEKVLGMNLVHFFHQVLPDGSEIGDT